MKQFLSFKLVYLFVFILTLTQQSLLAKKKSGLPDAEALKKLPKKWHNVKPVELFPASLKLKLSGKVDSGNGEKYDFNQVISEDVKKKLVNLGKDSRLFHFYFAPRDPRYKAGPGLSGHEFLKEVKNSTVRDDVGQVAWIYGEFKKNMDANYWLYRVTGDPWFIEDLVCWAEANQRLLDTGSKLFIPPSGRATRTFNKETDIQIQHVHAHFIAARLLAGKVVKEGGNAKDPNFIKAKKLFDQAWSQTENVVIGPVPTEWGKSKKGKPKPTYELGPTVKYIMDKFQIPGSLAFTIEFSPWNGNIERNITLLHAGCAAEMIYKVTKDEEYNKLSLLCERFFKAAMHMFQKGNHCVVDNNGTPYIWVHHTPGRDGNPNKNLPRWRGHPLFNAEDNGHGGSMARCLPLIWEAGPRFGCSTALMAAYTNTMADMCFNPTATKDGKPYYNNRLKNPWTRAKMGSAVGKKNPFMEYIWCMAFSPELLPGIRNFTGPFSGLSKEKRPKENVFGLQIEVSRYLYQKWKKGRRN